MLRRLRVPKPVDGQITHYAASDGVGSWTITSDDRSSRRRVRRFLAEHLRGEPRIESVTLPAAGREPRSER